MWPGAPQVSNPEDLPTVIDLYVKLVQEDPGSSLTKNCGDTPLPDSQLLGIILRVFPTEERAECHLEEGGIHSVGEPLMKIPLEYARIDRRHILRVSGERCPGFSVQVRSQAVGSKDKRMLLLDMEKWLFVCDGRHTWHDISDVLVAAGAFRCDFFAKYRVLEELGHGSASRIYHCESVIDDVEDPEATAAPKLPLAVKMAHKGDSQIARERRTLRAASRHPHIIQSYGFFELDDPPRFAFLMPAMMGGDLHMQMTRKGRFVEPKAACAGRQLCLALAHLHGRKIVHRDLKPENVVLCNTADKSLHLCLVDFGLASFEGHEDMRMRCGTPGYVAPEVLRHQEYNTMGDCFSVGSVLFYCIRGRCPFRGSNVDDVLRKNLKADYNMNDLVWETISQPCKDLVSGLLEKEPSRRLTAEDALSSPWVTSFGDGPYIEEAVNLHQTSQQKEDKRFIPHLFRNTSGRDHDAVMYKKARDYLKHLPVGVGAPCVSGNAKGPMAPHGPPERGVRGDPAQKLVSGDREVASNQNSQASTPTYPGGASSSQPSQGTAASSSGPYPGGPVTIVQERVLEPSFRQMDEKSDKSRSTSSATHVSESSGSSWHTLHSVGSRPSSSGPSIEFDTRKAQHQHRADVAGVAQRKRGLFEEFVKQFHYPDPNT